MSTLFMAPTDPLAAIQGSEHVTEGVSQPPVVITEQEVLFSTAAALLPRTKPTRAIVALRAMFLSSSPDARPARQHYPPLLNSSLDRAAMEREMHRL